MYKADGPEALRPVGETEFVNGVAAMSASGRYGKTRIAAGIVGTADLVSATPWRDVLDAQIAAGGGRFRGIRQSAALGCRARPSPNHRTNPPEAPVCATTSAPGFAHLAPRRLTFERGATTPRSPT